MCVTKSRETTKNSKKKCIIDMLTKIKFNHIKFLIQLQNKKCGRQETGMKNNDHKQTTVTDMTAINPATTFSVTINDLYMAAKSLRLSVWIKHNSIFCCLQETLLKYEDMYRLKVRVCQKIVHSNTKTYKIAPQTKTISMVKINT